MGRLEELRINAYLSEVARGYSNNSFVADALFPTIYSEKEKIDIFEFNKEAFQIYDTERAIRANSNVISPKGFKKHTATLKENDLSYPIDYREEQEYNKFIDEQISKGTLLPANKRTILSIFNELDNIKQFGEDSSVIKDFKSFIESLHPQVAFGETAVKSKQISVKAESDKFSDADEESLAIFQEAKNLAEKENITFKEALLKLNI